MIGRSSPRRLPLARAPSMPCGLLAARRCACAVDAVGEVDFPTVRHQCELGHTRHLVHPGEAMTDTVPALGDLLKDAPSNWGKWGPDDEVGALNYLGTAEVLAARVAHPQRQRVHPAAADRRPEGRPGVAGPHAGRADADHGRVDLGRRRRPGLPRRPALRRRQDQRLPAGLDAVRRARPRLVRRQALERLRRAQHRRRHGQGERRADRAARRRRARRAARHGPLPRQGLPRHGRDLHPRGPAGVRREAGRRAAQARHPA